MTFAFAALMNLWIVASIQISSIYLKDGCT